MKKNLLFVFVCLTLYQTLIADSGKANAGNAVPDTLSWTWEVSSTVSTQTKTCTLEFSDNLLVNWGDGVTEWIPDSLSSQPITHVYSVQANYNCTAIGVGISYFKADSRRVLNIDPKKAPEMTYLSCTGNQIGALDLTMNTQLISLYCGSNKLKTLNLSRAMKLQTLTCSDNQLAELDVSMLAALKKVTCHTNPLVRIGVHPFGALNYLSCSGCSLSAEMLDSIFRTLPTLGTVSASKNLYVLNNSGSSSCHSEIAAAKNWTLDRVITKNSFYVPSVTCKTADSVQVNICLKNTAPAIAFELDVLVPDGFVLDTLRSCLSAARKGEHLLSIVRMTVSGQRYKMMAYSLKIKDSFSGTDGPVLDLYLKAPAEIKTYALDIQNAILMDTLTNSMDLSVTDGQMSVAATSLAGDANGDDMVNVTDIVNLVAWINGRRPVDMDSTAIDIDGNGLWNIADVTKLVVIINTGATMLKSVDVRTSIKAIYPYNPQEAPSGNHLFVRQSFGNSSSLELCLNNVDAVQAFQTDLILPEGLSLQEGQFSQKTERSSGHFFSICHVSENRYRLLSYALKPDAAFSGKAGVLANLSLVGAEEFPYGDYPVSVDQSILTGMDLASVSATSYDAVVTLGHPANESKVITFGTDCESCLWVHGDGITEFSVWDIAGKLLLDKSLNDVNHYRISVDKGIYFVWARTKTLPGCYQKVAVK